MKTLLNMLAFLAVVNLLAMGIFVAWLWRSGRLDAERVHEIRSMLATPISVVEAAEDAAAAAAAEDAAQQAAQLRRADPPMNSTAQNQREAQLVRHESLLRRRIEDERRLLLAGLDAQVQVLESRQADIAQAEFDRAAADAAANDERAAAQFAKAVRQLESVPAKQGKAILIALVTQDQFDQAVAYLDAMNPRAAAKVLREFKTDAETGLATKLLEALRTYGLEEAARKEPGDAATISAADAE